MKYASRQARIAIGFIILLTIFGLLIAVHVVTEHSTPPAPKPSPTVSYSPPTPVSVAQPPSAREVAKSLHGTDFHELGPAPAGAVVDSGWFMIDGHKYAVDTFENERIRDQWLATAMNLGVAPKWETTTSVTYPSVT